MWSLKEKVNLELKRGEMLNAQLKSETPTTNIVEK